MATSNRNSSYARPVSVPSAKTFVPVLVGVIAFVLGGYICVGRLASNDWNPSVFIQFPAIDEPMLDYAESLLGEVITSPGLGHDGKFFFMQAMDPFFMDPETHAVFLDRPTYRAQRMVYPTISGGLGLLGATATAWTMVGLNVLALGIGTWLTARLAIQLGISAWFGLGFALNPGVLVSSFINTADVFAMLFFVSAALFLLRSQLGWATVSLTLAVLSRETMLLAVVGAAIFWWRREHSMPLLFAVPLLATAGWWLYLKMRLSGIDDSVQDTAAIGPPFKGFADAMSYWLANPDYLQDMLMGIVLALASVAIAIRMIRRATILGSMTAGFVLIAILMIDEVWLKWHDSSRALAPIITAYILLIPSSSRPPEVDSLGSSASSV